MSGEDDIASGLESIVGSLPATARMRVLDSETHFGVAISFSEPGFGFGEFVLAVDKATGQAVFDNDCMSADRCAKFLRRTVGTPVLDREADEG